MITQEHFINVSRSKIADVRTSELDAKLAPGNLGPWNFVFW